MNLVSARPISTPAPVLGRIAADVASGKSFTPGLTRLAGLQRAFDEVVARAQAQPLGYDPNFPESFEHAIERVEGLTRVEFPAAIGAAQLQAANQLVMRAIDLSVRAEATPRPADRAAIVDALEGARVATAAAQSAATTAVRDFAQLVAQLAAGAGAPPARPIHRL